MKFVSLISRPLGHPAALCFSRLAGLNRRPQSCRTKFIEEWHFSGQLWTHYIWHHFNWEKIGALPILSQENHISCCCQYTSGIFQGIWLNSNNSTNLLQKSRANTSQGINCISAADTKEFGPQNRAGILSLNHCQVPPTKDSGLFAGIRSFFFTPTRAGWVWKKFDGRKIVTKHTSRKLLNQQDSSSIHFLSFKCHAFLRQSCSTSLSPLLASTFLRLWQQSLLSHWASSWFAAFICGHDSAEQLESQKFKQWDPNPTGWLCLTTDIRRIYIYFYFMDCQPNHHCMSSGLARLGERRARSCGLGAPLAPGSLVIQQHEICIFKFKALIQFSTHQYSSCGCGFFFMCTCRRPQFALFVSWVHLPFDNVSNSHPVNILKTCKKHLQTIGRSKCIHRYTVRCQYCWLVSWCFRNCNFLMCWNPWLNSSLHLLFPPLSLGRRSQLCCETRAPEFKATNIKATDTFTSSNKIQ